VYVGNLSYDVKYRDLIEFMRGGGWGRFSSWPLVFFLVVVAVAAAAAEAAPWSEEGPRRQRASSVIPAQWELDQESLLQSCENMRGRVWIRPMSCGGFDGP
jgi:hypothetical protein